MIKDEATIAAQFTDTELSVDDFDNPIWTKADPVFIHRLWSGVEAPAARHAEVRIIWSLQSLTLRFLCEQRERLIVSTQPQLNKKTIGLWERDVCEFFVAPHAARPHRYLEFEVAPTGEWLDLAIAFINGERHTDWDFESQMAAAARSVDNEVVMTMQLPWNHALPKPNAGDVWRANLFRCIGVGNERYLAWQPTGTVEPNFHVPEAFGRLEFFQD